MYLLICMIYMHLCVCMYVCIVTMSTFGCTAVRICMSTSVYIVYIVCVHAHVTLT